jgi:hypothetical protein
LEIRNQDGHKKIKKTQNIFLKTLKNTFFINFLLKQRSFLIQNAVPSYMQTLSLRCILSGLIAENGIAFLSTGRELVKLKIPPFERDFCTMPACR